MPEMVKLTLILLVVCLCSAAALSQTYNNTKAKIQENNDAVESLARIAVIPGAQSVTAFTAAVPQEFTSEAKNVEAEVKKSASVYTGVDKDGKVLGYAFTVSEKGFSGDIKVMVGCGKNDSGELAVTGTRVLLHTETPGLGAEMNTVAYEDVKAFGDKAVPLFQKQFIGKTASQLYLKKTDPAKGTIDSMTAATISSRAFTKAVREGIEKFRTELKEVPGE